MVPIVIDQSIATNIEYATPGAIVPKSLVQMITSRPQKVLALLHFAFGFARAFVKVVSRDIPALLSDAGGLRDVRLYQAQLVSGFDKCISGSTTAEWEPLQLRTRTVAETRIEYIRKF